MNEDFAPILAALARIERKQGIYELIENNILGTLETQNRLLVDLHNALRAPARPSETAETLAAILVELKQQSGMLHGSLDDPEC